MSSQIDALRPTLQAILNELGLLANEAQCRALLEYLALLERWNSTYNLTAVRDPAQMLIQHLADCLAVVHPLERQRGIVPFRLLDVGSGGGLPGVVIAIMSSTTDVTCVDTVGKKAAFIRQVAAELRLSNLHAQHSRVEEMRDGRYDVIASRAFASLADFTRLTKSQLAPGGVWLAMKSKDPVEERKSIAPDVAVFHVEQLHVPRLDGDRCIIWARVMS